MASNPIVNIFKIKELRNRIFFTFIILAVFRLGGVLTIPGIDASVLLQYFDNLASQNKNQFASYMDFFVGGAFSHFSIFMLGVMPYISTQIILQLALIIFPSLKRIAQDDGGQRKVAAWTRIGTVGVCLIQSFAVTVYADSIPGAWTGSIQMKLLAMLTVTTGTMITIWLGDQITAHGIGNGISMLLFAGIVARLPSAVLDLADKVSNNEINVVFVIVVLIMFVGIIGLVIFEERGERKISVNYAKRVVGRKMYGGNSNQYIPFKINPSNVIPVIFASSFLTFPLQIISSIGSNQNSARWVGKLSAFLNPAGWWYNILMVILIVFFAYFYTQVKLNPIEIAKNIRENGGSIPTVRADKTGEYLQRVLNRLVLPGSLFLAAIAVLPTVIQNLFGFPQSISMLMGGTSLIIMVGVDLDTMSQVEAILRMHRQDGLTKKGKIRSRNL